PGSCGRHGDGVSAMARAAAEAPPRMNSQPARVPVTTTSPSARGLDSAITAASHGTATAAAPSLAATAHPAARKAARFTAVRRIAATGTPARSQENWNEPTTPRARPNATSAPYAAPLVTGASSTAG